MLADVCHPEFYKNSNQDISFFIIISRYQTFAIFFTHTLFQLFHVFFSKSYLQSVHDDGVVKVSDELILSSTRLYEFRDPEQRGEWLDILALIEYLRSGSSWFGYLNNVVIQNMLHKDCMDSTQDNDPGSLVPSEEEMNSDNSDHISFIDCRANICFATKIRSQVKDEGSRSVKVSKTKYSTANEDRLKDIIMTS